MKKIYVVLFAALTAISVSANNQPSGAGQPGDTKAVDRTIAISAEDIKFSPTVIRVRVGETVKFVVTNHGKLPHEFVIAGRVEQEEHEKEMQSMGAMQHMDPNAVSVSPGETKVLIWKFDSPGVFQYGCHVPGHYAAGMAGIIHVK